MIYSNINCTQQKIRLFAQSVKKKKKITTNAQYLQFSRFLPLITRTTKSQSGKPKNRHLKKYIYRTITSKQKNKINNTLRLFLPKHQGIISHTSYISIYICIYIQITHISIAKTKKKINPVVFQQLFLPHPPSTRTTPKNKKKKKKTSTSHISTRICMNIGFCLYHSINPIRGK